MTNMYTQNIINIGAYEVNLNYPGCVLNTDTINASNASVNNLTVDYVNGKLYGTISTDMTFTTLTVSSFINASKINASIINTSEMNTSIINSTTATNTGTLTTGVMNSTTATNTGTLTTGTLATGVMNSTTATNSGTLTTGDMNSTTATIGTLTTSTIVASTSLTINYYGNTHNFRSGTPASPGDLATINSGTFNSTSDIRVKNIIRYITIDESTDFINNTNPILFNWKNDTTQRLISGYIAQEVIKTANHLVYTSENNEMKESTDGPEGKQYVLNYDGIIPYHGVAIKHLLEENIELKKEVKELSRKIDILTTKFDLLNN
jgi:hypothetical protein